MSAWNKFNTCSRGNVLHPSFYGDSVHVVYRNNKKHWVQTERFELQMPFQHHVRSVYSYHILERAWRERKQIHPLILATDRHCLGRWWRSVNMSWQYLPLWRTFLGGLAILMGKDHIELVQGVPTLFYPIHSLLTPVDFQDLIHCIHVIVVCKFIWTQKQTDLTVFLSFLICRGILFIFTMTVNVKLFQKSPPEYFLFNLTFPSCTPVEFCNEKVHYNTFLMRLKGSFCSENLVLTLTGRVYAWLSKPSKAPRRIMVECIIEFQTGGPVSVCSLPMRALNEFLPSTESI